MEQRRQSYKVIQFMDGSNGLLIQWQATMCEAILVIVSSCHLRRPLGGGHGTGDNTVMLNCVRFCLCFSTKTCRSGLIWFACMAAGCFA